MTIEKKLLATNPVSGEVLPEAVSFDGSGDHLKRTSDLTNNANGRAFTFSFWVYRAKNSQANILDNNTAGVLVQMDSGGQIGFRFKNGSNSGGLNHTADTTIPLNTWTHVIISGNMNVSNAVRIYFNDVQDSGSISYSSTDISFSTNIHYIGGEDGTGSFLDGRLAHVYLEYDYFNLNTVSNRRLFITADGKPADSDTLAARNPIMYLPMKDAATAGSNSGTGGDFTAIGVLATAERGPNQDNCSASKFDGSADYLSRSSITNIADGKQVTFSCTISETDSGSTANIFGGFNAAIGGSPTVRMVNGALKFTCTIPPNGATLVSATATSPLPFAEGSHHSIQISFDLADTSKRHMFINGVEATVTWHTYTNANMPFTHPTLWQVMNEVGATDRTKGEVGELYFNTVYTDLATSNPFWDSDTNRPNSVRKVIADTSVTPLIALPLICSDAGKNFGSGGDFTVNSGPYTGARGGSEFWARGAELDSGGYLRRDNGLTGAVNNKTFTGVFYIDATKSNISTNTSEYVIYHDNAIQVLFNNGYFQIILMNASGTQIAKATASPTMQGNRNIKLIFMISVDLSDTGKRYLRYQGLYNGSSYVGTGVTWNTYSNDNINHASSELLSLAHYGGTDFNLGIMYMANSYIDFSQEANRNKFVDQLGYPKDLTKQIEDGDIATPLVYMKFDPTSLGTNSGSGGNFGLHNSPKAGADVNPYT